MTENSVSFQCKYEYVCLWPTSFAKAQVCHQTPIQVSHGVNPTNKLREHGLILSQKMGCSVGCVANPKPELGTEYILVIFCMCFTVVVDCRLMKVGGRDDSVVMKAYSQLTTSRNNKLKAVTHNLSIIYILCTILPQTNLKIDDSIFRH